MGTIRRFVRSGARPLGRAIAALLVVATLVLPCPLQAQVPVPDVTRLMDYIDDLYRAQSSYSSLKMTVVRERGIRELEMEAWSLGDDDALFVIRSPAREAGTATLRTEEGLWNYAPRADRLIRIPTGLLSESWNGSHFTNDDLVRETSFLDDYDARVERVERDGTPYLQATLTPKPDAPVVYSHLVFLVTIDGWIPVRTEYYDEGELIRIMEFDHIITQEEARTGRLPQGVRTNMRVPGTRLRHWISALSFATVFYEVLSDDSIPYDKDASPKQRDGDLISYIIMYDKLFNLGHGRFIQHWREEGKI